MCTLPAIINLLEEKKITGLLYLKSQLFSPALLVGATEKYKITKKLLGDRNDQINLAALLSYLVEVLRRQYVRIQRT